MREEFKTEDLDSAKGARAQKKVAEASAIKLLPKLIDAFRWAQKPKIAEIGEAMAAAIETQHPAVAKRIRDSFGYELLQIKSVVKPERLVSFEDAAHGFEQVVLPANVETECRAIVHEHRCRDALAAYGLTPRHRVLLHGAPGNGKTLLAEALAYELQVPFLRVKYGGLVDSHLGETGKNIEIIMDYAKTAPCVLFLDEFDGIGMDRNDNRDVGEVRRITNQLLIHLERLPSSCVFVGATNAPNLIDAALQRRFDFVIEVPAPTDDLKRRCAQKELHPSITPGFDLQHLSDRIAVMPVPSLYAVVELCRRMRRDMVLNKGQGIEALMLAGPAT